MASKSKSKLLTFALVAVAVVTALAVVAVVLSVVGKIRAGVTDLEDLVKAPIESAKELLNGGTTEAITTVTTNLETEASGYLDTAEVFAKDAAEGAVSKVTGWFDGEGS